MSQSPETTNHYEKESDAYLRYLLREATRKANTARGPSAAQSADRTAARIRAEIARRAN